MPAIITILYPQGAKFNMDYFLSTHMPLVQKKLGQHGLTSWKVLEYGKEAPYCVQATLEFSSMSAFQKAAGSPEAKDVFGDVPNFTDKESVFMPGEVKATS